LTMRAIP